MFLYFIIAFLLSSNVFCIDHSLPNLSDGAYMDFPIEKEKKLGQIFYNRLYADGYIYKDNLIADYLQHIGSYLVKHSPNPGFQFNFIPINDESINAFAFFGGNIGVNIGLIQTVSSEGELASVLAHEISHVTQRHLARIYFENKKLLPLTFLELLMAAAVGVMAPDVGMYGVQAVLMGHSAKIIGYQRNHEEEADRIGLQILSKSGFSPTDMYSMFKKIDEQSKLAEKPPLYLSTHPMYETRMADVTSRMQELPYRQRADSFAFKMVKARLDVNIKNPLDSLENYEKILVTKRYKDEDSAKYGYFLALLKNGLYDEAKKELNSLLKKHPNQLFLKISQVEFFLEKSDYIKAESLVKSLMQTYPNNLNVAKMSNKILFSQKRYIEVEKNTRNLLLHYPGNFELAKDLVKALMYQNKLLEGYLVSSDLFKLQGDFAHAHQQLTFAENLQNVKQEEKNSIYSRRILIEEQKALYKELGAN